MCSSSRACARWKRRPPHSGIRRGPRGSQAGRRRQGPRGAQEQAEAAEADKRKKEETRRTPARAENCKRAKDAKATYDSGVRVARTNAQGEREFVDDAQRKAEVTRLEAIIAKDCKA